MRSAKITALHDEYSELIEFCRSNNQVSFEMYINDTYKKSLLLSVASFFEATITKAIHDYVDTKSRQTPEIVAFVDNKAIKRQYHTFFSWDGNNANQFFGLFGEDFKRRARGELGRKFDQDHLMKQKWLLWQSVENETGWYIKTMLKHKLTTHLRRFGSNI